MVLFDEMKPKNKKYAKQVCALAFIVFHRVHVYPDSLGSTQMSQFLLDCDNNNVAVPGP